MPSDLNKARLVSRLLASYAASDDAKLVALVHIRAQLGRHIEPLSAEAQATIILTALRLVTEAKISKYKK